MSTRESTQESTQGSTRGSTRGSAQGSTRALHEALAAIGSDLDLHAVLDRTVSAACRLTSARYGVLGVLGDSGNLLDLVTHGMSGAVGAVSGEHAEAQRILDLLLGDPRPMRRENVSQACLGVPIRIRGTVFGYLYLARKSSGRSFTADDESLVETLATAAGYVVDNARTYAMSERRRLLLEATTQVTEALQPPVRLHEALQQIAISARRVSGAATVAVVQRHDDRQEVAAADGVGVDAVPGVVEHLRMRIAGAEDEPEVAIVPESGGRTVVLVPLRAHVADNGVLLILLEQGRRRLEAEEIELLVSFADQASFALDRAQAISDRARLAIVSDRERIARDLHDVVIQRLFATGLHLQGAQRNASGGVAERLSGAVADLDLTIRDIRSTIFELKNAHRFSVRVDVNVLAKEYAAVLGFAPAVRTAGPVDTAVSAELGEQLVAVLREALSNVAQHARARSVVIELEVYDERLLLRVTDDGRGMPAETHESGLRNVRTRAREQGGFVRIYSGEPRGTVLEWRVPLSY